MAMIAFRQFGFTYAGQAAPALTEISLSIAQGAFVLLCGPAGSGKSTLLRQLKTAVRPAGQCQGEILYQGQPLAALGLAAEAQAIGLVGQNPYSQGVMALAQQEIAFPLENIGLPQPEMAARVAELASYFGLSPLLDKPLETLSGGQRQMVNLAAALALQPEVLLLDEPLAQLDPIMARDFLQMLQRLNDELGMTIVLSSHQLEAVLPLADQVVILQAGRVLADTDSQGACRCLYSQPALRDYVPALARIAQAAAQALGQRQETVPLTVKAGRQWASGYRWRETIPAGTPAAGEVLLEARHIAYRYHRQEADVLRDLSLSLRAGELLAVLGGNGSGKSTLLKALLGICQPQQGQVRLLGKGLRHYSGQTVAQTIGYLAQNPQGYFITERVGDEAARRQGAAADAPWRQRLWRLFQLEGLESRHPYDLSGGQQQRLALYLVCSRQPRILLMDEPTKGLDPESKAALAALLGELLAQGTAVLMVTHDLDFAAQYAQRCALLFQGTVALCQETRDFLSSNHFYTTGVNKVFKPWAPRAVTVADVEAVAAL